MFPLRALLVCALLLASGAAPSPRSADVDGWLDRAATEIRASREGDAPPPATPSELELAITLVRLRGNDADRALLREMIDRRRPDGPKADPKLAEFNYRAMVAIAYAALDERDEAMEMANSAHELSTAAEEIKLPLVGSIVPHVLTHMWAHVGDAKAARAAALKAPAWGDQIWSLTSVAQELHDAGLKDPRDAALAEATKIAMEKKEDVDTAAALRKVAQALIKLDRLDDAAKVIEQMPAEFGRCDAQIDLARARDAAGDKAAATKMLDAALSTVDAMPRGYRWMFYPQVAHAAGEMGAGEILTRAAAAAEQALANEAAHLRASAFARLARDFANVGDLAAMDRFATAVDGEIRKRNTPQESSKLLLTLAGAFARAGQNERAIAALARSKELHTSEDYSVDEEFSQLLSGFVEAGSADQAIELAKEHGFEAGDMDYLHEDAARLALRGGEYAAAARHADQITLPNRRIRAYRSIALAYARAARTADAERWIGALGDPHTRAMLYVTLAQHGLEVDNIGWGRSLRF